VLGKTVVGLHMGNSEGKGTRQLLLMTVLRLKDPGFAQRLVVLEAWHVV
jgi:hypothetical protein